MKRKVLKDDVSRDDLNHTQEKIVDEALKNPELSHSDIADRVDVDRSYVSRIHSEYLEEEVMADEVSPDDIDEEIYEMIVAGMEANDEVERVERQYDLDLDRGDAKEVDIAVWISKGGYDFLVIIEAKHHDIAIEQDVVAAMAWYRDNSAASEALVVSKSGFQSGAESLAQDTNIDLEQLDKLTEEAIKDRITKINFNLIIRPRQSEIIDLGLHPLGDDPHEGDVGPLVNRNPDLFDEEKRPVGKTVFERAQEAAIDKSPGTYEEDISNRLMLLEDRFYRLSSIKHEVRQLDRQELEFQYDAHEEADLYRQNVLDDEDSVDFVSLTETIRAFEEDVR